MTDRIGQLRALPPNRVAVVLVDFQNDFCGAPGTTGNAETARRAHAFAATAADRGFRVVYTQQVLDLDRLSDRQRRWETPGGLCAAGSRGAELFVPVVPGGRVVRKHRFDVWQSAEFLATLAEWDIDGLVIGGVELQCCVLYAVLGAEERGYHYVVPQDLVSGIDRCDETSNPLVRAYLRTVHPTVETAAELIDNWSPPAAGRVTATRSSRSPDRS